MSFIDYQKACKAGKKNFQLRLLKGQRPTLSVLDDILPPKGKYSEVSLGLVQIPLDQVVGTRHNGRSYTFANNFMPIMKENSEFAGKWAKLSTCHAEEGIRDPIKAYEYMNQFYVEEGNKRVSVMKYFGAVSIAGTVTRIIPQKTNEKENKIYYEFLDFYEVSKVNYVQFTEEGCYARLQKAVGKKPGERWSDEDQMDFSSVFARFSTEFVQCGGNKLAVTPSDAFLTFISIHNYSSLKAMDKSEMKKLILKSWNEFKLIKEDKKIDLKMAPPKEKASLLSKLLPTGLTKLPIAFIYEKTPASSAWTYAHELGRLYLNETFPEEVTTKSYENVTADNIESCIEDAVKNGCKVIFTTTPSFTKASVKAAIAHPNIKIVNCSVNTSYCNIRTYYPRMHEAKFLVGAIAAALSENNQIFYLADYPINGTIANINAFALGAKMINPRAEIHLEWSCKKDIDINKQIRLFQAGCISGKDMIVPEDSSRYFGVYNMNGDIIRRLAMPICYWGKLYEKLVRAIMDGTWKHEGKASASHAINYWWGISAGIVDVICSQNLPLGTQRLVNFLKENIKKNEFNPFSGILYSQEGIVQPEPDYCLTPEEIINMDWLAENVIGNIPAQEELKEQAEPLISQQGIIRKG